MNSGPIQPSIQTVLNAGNYGSGETVVRVLSLPEGLQSLPQTVKISGELTQTNNDGAARIQTPEGEIVVQYPPKRTPVEGQKLDIELPAGNPPQKAALRPSTPPQENRAATTPQASAAPEAQRNLIDRITVQAPPEEQAASPSQSPSQIKAQAPLTQDQQNALNTVRAALRAASAQKIEIGSVVRISPVSLAKLQTLIVSAETVLGKNALTPDQFLKLVQNLIPQKSGTILNQAPSTQTPQSLLAAPDNPVSSLFKSEINLPLQSILPSILESLSPVLGDVKNLDLVKLILAKFSVTNFASLTTPAFDDGLDVQITKIGTQQIPSSFAPLEKLEQTTPLNSTPNLQNSRIIALTSENFPVIVTQTNTGDLPEFFILQASSSHLSLGEDLELVPVAVQSFSPATSAPLVPRGFNWSGLDQLFKTLLGFDLTSLQTLDTQTLALQSLGGRTPFPVPSLSAPHQLGSAALLFLSVLRSGDIASWLGDKNIEALKRAGKIDLLGKLTETVLRAKNANAETVGEWRVQHLPMTYQGAILPLSIFYRQQYEDPDKDQDQAKKQTRFIIDLALNRMGPVQVDGLVREKKLDVILRTETQLSDAMITEMRKIYAGAMSQTSFQGELAFQSRPEQFVKIEDTPSKSGLGMNA